MTHLPRFVLIFLLLGLVVQADTPVELRILWFDDGNESVAFQPLLDDFEAAHPDIQVELDIFSSSTGGSQLPLQLQSDAPPDLARHTNLDRYRDIYLDLRPYLDNADDWDTNFPAPLLAAMRADPTNPTLHGYPTDITVSAPFVNYTLFERAGVAVPDGETVTWADWTTAAAEVQARLAEDGETVHAITMDRSGHRFWGMSLGQCATYLDETGNFSADNPGFRASAALLRDWHLDGLTPLDVWGGMGDDYLEPSRAFIDGQIAVYYSGNWLLSMLSEDIGDTFKWGPVPNPGDDCGKSGMVGGAVPTAFNTTQHPEAVGKLMSHLSTEANLAAFYSQSRTLPGHSGLASRGLLYSENNDELNIFAQELATIQDQAFQLQYHPESTAYHSAVRRGLIEMVVQDLTIDETVAMIEAELAGEPVG
jgi:alpha-1,4-digalacturonate transport system substrate-binding protein